MYLFTVMSIVSAGILCNTIAVSPVFEEHHYLEKTGTTPTRIEWRLERGASHKLTVTRPNETYVCLCNDSFDTYQWEVKKPSAHTEIVAKREGNAIVIGGTFEGEAIKKELQIDDAPWYQAMTLSLKSLIT